MSAEKDFAVALAKLRESERNYYRNILLGCTAVLTPCFIASGWVCLKIAGVL
jgi:hypothetical protein